MERRKFIVSATGALAGIAISPAFGMVTTQNGLVVSLPKCENHIRHGLLTTDSNQDSVSQFRWIKNIERNRFYENGHSPEDNDLFQTSLSFGSKQITFNKNKNQLWVLNDTEIKSFDFTKNGTHKVHSDEGIDVFATKGKPISIPKDAVEAMLILPFEGNYRSNSQIFNEDQALLFQNQAINAQITTEEITLIIIKNG